MKHEVRRCSVEGCKQKHYAKDWCKKHYSQVARHGRLVPETERGLKRPCTAPGCTKEDGTMVEYNDELRALCTRHRRQYKDHGRLTPEREHAWGVHDGCLERGCDAPHRAKGYCRKHYNQRRWLRIKEGLKKLKMIEANEVAGEGNAA